MSRSLTALPSSVRVHTSTMLFPFSDGALPLIIVNMNKKGKSVGEEGLGTRLRSATAS